MNTARETQSYGWRDDGKVSEKVEVVRGSEGIFYDVKSIISSFFCWFSPP